MSGIRIARLVDLLCRFEFAEVNQFKGEKHEIRIRKYHKRETI